MTEVQRIFLAGAWRTWVLDARRRYGTPSWRAYAVRLGCLAAIPEDLDE